MGSTKTRSRPDVASSVVEEETLKATSTKINM